MFRIGKKIYFDIVTSIVILTITSALCTQTIYGKTVSENKQIENKFDELNQVVAQYNKGKISLLERDKKIAALESSLKSYGVEPLSMKEAEKKGIISDGSSNFTKAIVPGNTVNTKFYNKREKCNSNKYEIQTIRAVPLTEKSSLSESDIVTMNQKAEISAAKLVIIKAVVASSASLSKKTNVVYSAYDLLHNIYTSVTGKTKIGNSKVVYDYDVQTNVCFKYIKKVGESDDKQILCQIANKCSGYCYAYYKQFSYKDSSYTSSSIQKEIPIKSNPKYYNNNVQALNYYLGKTSVYKYFASPVKLSGMESQFILKLYPSEPSFPSQIQ